MLNLDRVARFGVGAARDHDPQQAIEALRHLAGDLRALAKTTLLCRILLGRQLILIQKHELWRRIERRDYRRNSSGEPMWQTPAGRVFNSWYNFLEEGFEPITGLHRQTAYSAIKLADSGALNTLSSEELFRFKRLANALELASAERSGVPITPALLVQAQELPIAGFRLAAQRARSSVIALSHNPLRHITELLKAAAARDPNVLAAFWTILEDAMMRANKDPVLAMKQVVATCSPEEEFHLDGSCTAEAS